MTSALRGNTPKRRSTKCGKAAGGLKVQIFCGCNMYYIAPCANKVGAGIYYAPFLGWDIVLGEGHGTLRLRG